MKDRLASIEGKTDRARILQPGGKVAEGMLYDKSL